jgi:hypothetical protein
VLAFLTIQQFTFAQSSEKLSSQLIFEETVKYYDSTGIWDNFSGKMRMTSLMNGNLTPQEISINNNTDVYKCIRNREDGTYVKGVENGESFFTINGKEYTADEIPEKYQKYPYSLSEYYAQTYKEHHTFHFSIPLALKKAEAKPLEGVGKKYLFGKQCSSITFTEYPNHFENGYYGIQITLYVLPNENYKIHAVHFDNGWGESKEGLIVLFDGEINVEGIKVPASKLTFFAGSLKFLIADVFENISE